MGSASHALAQALASQASQLNAQGTVGRTASRLRNVSMRVPDRYHHTFQALSFSQAAMPSLHVNLYLHQAEGCPSYHTAQQKRNGGPCGWSMQGATGGDASRAVASEYDHFCVPACWADHASADKLTRCIKPCSGQHSR